MREEIFCFYINVSTLTNPSLKTERQQMCEGNSPTKTKLFNLAVVFIGGEHIYLYISPVLGFLSVNY